MKIRHIYILTIISIFTIFSCTKEKSEGPSINELYGDFDGTASLLVSNKNPNFSNNEVTKFSCEFGKIVDWKISITGLVSNAKKIITGNSAITDFTFGVSDRGASIRIPIITVEKGWKGWLEDRRPASNGDPYKIAGRIIKTVKSANIS